MIPLARKIRLLFRRRRLERDLEDELNFHLEMTELEMQENATGDRAEAARRLGNAVALREKCRAVWTFTALEIWLQDVRYAIRTLKRTPGFVLAAIAALAFGIGADTAVFTIVNGALSWNLGVDHVDRVVMIQSTDVSHSRDFGVSWPDFQDFLSQAKSFSAIAAYQYRPVNLSDDASWPERNWCASISAAGFRVSGQMPAFGRLFNADDERPGAPAVVLLSHHVWEERYGRDPRIIGRSIRVDDVPSTVIGVMPPGKRFPEDSDLWKPLIPDAQMNQRGSRNLMLLARLADGSSVAAARNELTTIMDRLARQYPATNRDLTARVLPVVAITGAYGMRPIFIALWMAVGFVLLIACADIANMLLARGAARRREIAIRLSLGAGRGRIIRQLLIESVLLSLAGGCAGWMVALGGLRWFEAASRAAPKPAWLNLSLDQTAFWYLAAISIGSGIAFGLAPAFRLANIDAHTAMKDGGQAVSGSRRALSLGNLLVALQMMLSLILLAGAGLMIRSMVNLYGAPIGVDTARVLTMQVNLPEAKYPSPAREAMFFATLGTRLNALPGVESVSIVSRLPFGGFASLPVETDHAAVDPSHVPLAGVMVAGPGYFQVMRAAPKRGRVFSVADLAARMPVIVVNESFAAKFWPAADALGRRLRITVNHTPLAWFTVIGVVPDILQDFHDPLAHDPLIYLPYSEAAQRDMYVVAKTRVPPERLAADFRRAVAGVDSHLAVDDVRSLDDRMAQQRLSTALLSGMFSVFAVIALVLAALGLYAVIAHSVNQRTQEIGVRMALGGARGAVLALVLRQAMRPILLGIIPGLPLAFAVTHALRMVLVGVSPGDPVALGGSILALALAGALGCAIPAHRAISIEPTVALRYE